MKLFIRETSRQNEPPSNRAPLWVCCSLSCILIIHIIWLIIGDWSGNGLFAVCVNMDGSEEGLVESDSLRESYKTKLYTKTSPQWISSPCWRAAGWNIFSTFNAFFHLLEGNGIFTVAFLKPLGEKPSSDIDSRHKQNCRPVATSLKHTHLSINNAF